MTTTGLILDRTALSVGATTDSSALEGFRRDFETGVTIASSAHAGTHAAKKATIKPVRHSLMKPEFDILLTTTAHCVLAKTLEKLERLYRESN